MIHRAFTAPLEQTNPPRRSRGNYFYNADVHHSDIKVHVEISQWGTWKKCFPGGSVGKQSAYNAGDPGSTPGSLRSLGERNSNPLQ